MDTTHLRLQTAPANPQALTEHSCGSGAGTPHRSWPCMTPAGLRIPVRVCSHSQRSCALSQTARMIRKATWGVWGTGGPCISKPKGKCAALSSEVSHPGCACHPTDAVSAGAGRAMGPKELSAWVAGTPLNGCLCLVFSGSGSRDVTAHFRATENREERRGRA